MKSQSKLLQLVKDIEPNNQKLIENLSNLLAVSPDSIYRRFRGKTSLTFDEGIKICQQFGISPSVLCQDDKHVLFRHHWQDPSQFSFKDFLQRTLNDIKMIPSGEVEVTFVAKDLPIFYNFLCPEIGQFKGFFWKKTALEIKEYKYKKFDLDEMDEEEIVLGQELLESYCQIPSIELWNNEILNSIISQIAYYHESGFFAKRSTGRNLLDKMEEMVNHLQQMAEVGKKFSYQGDVSEKSNWELYFNELIIGDNSAVVQGKGVQAVYIDHNIINNLMSNDPIFCKQTNTINKNLINRSTLMSRASEKERNKYFTRLKNLIEKERVRLTMV